MSDLQSLIDAQVKSMTELHLRVKELTADVAMYKERMEYWEKRARAAEPDDTLQELRAYGLEDHINSISIIKNYNLPPSTDTFGAIKDEIIDGSDQDA